MNRIMIIAPHPACVGGHHYGGQRGELRVSRPERDADVKDIQAVSPEPGEVVVYVLSRTGNGEASPELLSIVEAALNAEDIRPLTDHVTVSSATIVPYAVEAELITLPGPRCRDSFARPPRMP